MDDSKDVELLPPYPLWLCSSKNVDSKGRKITPALEKKGWEEWGFYFKSLMEKKPEVNSFLQVISSSPKVWFAVRNKGVSGNGAHGRGVIFLVMQESAGSGLTYMFGEVGANSAEFGAMFASEEKTGVAVGRYVEDDWPRIVIQLEEGKKWSEVGEGEIPAVYEKCQRKFIIDNVGNALDLGTIRPESKVGKACGCFGKMFGR